jgi:hypothetical protein
MDTTAIALVIPLVAIQLVLLIWALWDLSRPDRRVRSLPKAVWAVLIIFVSIIGPVLYLLFGRDEA